MTKQPTFQWDPSTGQAVCVLEYKNEIFVGTAKCDPVDFDMISEKTGLYIAEQRASIQFYQHIKNNEIKPQLQVLNHLCSTMWNSKNLNQKSYEFKRILKEINNLENDLITINNVIADTKETLKTYIDEKDSFYKKIREKRDKDKLD